jgi:hypothetical protein
LLYAAGLDLRPGMARLPASLEFAMIQRFTGLTPTRSRAVVHDGLVFTVAVSPDPAPPGH